MLVCFFASYHVSYCTGHCAAVSSNLGVWHQNNVVKLRDLHQRLEKRNDKRKSSTTGVFPAKKKKSLLTRGAAFFFFFFLIKRWLYSSPNHLDVASDVWGLQYLTNSPPTFQAMNKPCTDREAVLKWLPSCCLPAPCGCGPESAGAETEEGRGWGGREWDAHSGLDWQIRGFAGVTSASIVPSNSRLISHENCAFFPEMIGKKKVRKLKKKKKKAPRTSQRNMFNYILGWMMKMSLREGPRRSTIITLTNGGKWTLQICIFIGCSYSAWMLGAIF